MVLERFRGNDGIIAEVEGISGEATRKTVTIKVRSPKGTPKMVREIRAQAVAIKAVGLVDTAGDTVADIVRTRDLQRMASVVGHRKAGEMKNGLVPYRVQVSVRNY